MRLAPALLLLLIAPSASAQVLPFVPRPYEQTTSERLLSDIDRFKKRAAENAGVFPSGVVATMDSLAWRVRLAAGAIDQDSRAPQALLALIASGSLRDLAAPGAAAPGDDDLALASGSVGLRLASSFSQWIVQVHVASTLTTRTQGYATTLRDVGVVGRGVSVDYQRPRTRISYTGSSTPNRQIGYHVPVTLGLASWADGDAGRDVVVSSASARLTYDIAQAVNDASGAAYAIRFDVGATARAVHANGAGSKRFRRETLGTAQVVFPGVEAGASLLIGSLVAFARTTLLYEHAGTRAMHGPGGLHVVTGIALQGDLAPLAVRFR